MGLIKKLFVILVIVALIGGIWYFMFGSTPPATSISMTTTTRPPTSTPAPSTTTTPPPVPWVALNGLDYPNNDMTGSPFKDISQDDCRNKCSATPGCAAAVYSWSNRQCWLKSRLGESVVNVDLNVMVPQKTGGVAAWVKQPNMDHGGDDIACYFDGTGADKCASLCAAHKDCVAYNRVDPSVAARYPVWGRGGCCTKKMVGPTGPQTGIDYYTGTR